MRFSTPSVRARLTLWHAGVMALIICLFSVGIFVFVRARLYATLDDQIRGDLASIGKVYREEPVDLPELDQRMGISLFEVVDGGKVVYQTAGWPPAGAYRTGTSDLSALRITVARDEAPLRQTLWTLTMILTMGAPGATALAIMGGYFLAGRLLAPVGAMAATARRISAESLTQRLPVARSVGEVALQRSTSTAEYREVIGSMLEEVDRLTRLVENLLTLTRGESGRVVVGSDVVDLGELATNVSDSLHVLAEEKRQSLEVETVSHIKAMCDAAILRQGLINVLHNAIKYTPGGGAIRMVVKLSTSGEGMIEVHDTGPGIQAVDRQRIFERFYRVDGARSREAGGVGLGLAIARWAVEANGGRIEVESEAGGGALFRIILPLAEGDGRPGVEADPRTLTVP